VTEDAIRLVQWIVQTNLGGQSDIDALTAVLTAEKIVWHGFEVVPFSRDLPPFDYEGPVVCYGSTSFVLNCRRAGRWFPGVWHDEANFSWSAWAEHYGERLLNAPDCTERTTVDGLLTSARPDDELVFVRPDRDLKEFCGEVASVGKFKAWCRDVARGKFDQIGPDTPIVVGTPFGISAEWRLFMVAGVVAAASEYKRRGRLHPQEGAPPEVRAFAEETAAIWSPASVFTLDICRSGEGLFVVEAQGFNSAGYYSADLRALVHAVSAHAASEWGARPGAARHETREPLLSLPGYCPRSTPDL
jgi:hypothetical protein